MSELMTEKEVSDLLGKKRTALWRLRKKCGFPEPVLNYPAKYSKTAVDDWINKGGVNQRVS